MDINFEKIMFSILKENNENGLRLFEDYLFEVEGSFHSNVISLQTDYEKLSDEEKNEFGDYFGDEFYQIENFIGIHRKSILISIYSFLETSMNNLCSHVQRKYNYPIKVVDLHGQGIQRARLYLEKMASVDFQVLNVDWEFLKKANDIRNCLVHKDGLVSEDFANKLQELDNLDIKNGQIIVEKEYVEKFIEVVRRFLRHLYDTVLSGK